MSNSSRFDSLPHLKGRKHERVSRFRRPDKHQRQDVRVAHYQGHGEFVLLQRLALDATASAEARMAVLEAARSAVEFHHPSIVAVREVKLEGDAIVFVQDCPDGILLAEAMGLELPISMPEALRWMRAFANALAAARASGLMISQISSHDFVVCEPAAATSRRELICLCPPVPEGWWLEVVDGVFASPEQKSGAPCDIRSALYSAGAVLAVMLTKRVPAIGETWGGLLARCRVPQPVQHALRCVLEADPAKRCATPADWITLLDAVQTPTAEPAPAQVARTTAAAGATPQGRSWTWHWAAAAVLAVGIVWGLARSETVRDFFRHNQPATAAAVVIDPTPAKSMPQAGETSGKPVTQVPATHPESTAAGQMDPLTIRPAHPVPPAPPRSPAEVLLAQAQAAPPPERNALLRKVLTLSPGNHDALHHLVADALSDLPRPAAQRDELNRWIRALSDMHDPLGSHALGCMALADAGNTKDLTTATRTLIRAAENLKQSLKQGHADSYSALLQAYANLHNVQREDEDDRQAEITRQKLFEALENMPEAVPADAPRRLAERFEALLKDRSAQGTPHPQAAFLRTLIDRLYALAAKRGDAMAVEWLRLKR